MKYCLDKPYPPIDDLDMNIYFGQILLSNVGGLHSEMNSITLYFYNEIILQHDWPLLAEAMKQISIVEMHHLEIFSQMCYKLGVDPRLWECHQDFYEYWSPGYNVYPKQITTLLENAIIQEETAIQNYQYQMSCIDEPIIQNMLMRIIEDEKIHIEVFEYFLEEFHKYQK